MWDTLWDVPPVRLSAHDLCRVQEGVAGGLERNCLRLKCDWRVGDGEMASFGYDELAASMSEIASYSRGDTVSGSVLGFEPNGAMVDIGVKSSAYVTTQEMALVKPDKPEQGLDLGATYEFVVISRSPVLDFNT